jgi:diadenosine tetraphosphate (Ap4A) HIT family hydrolase
VIGSYERRPFDVPTYLTYVRERCFICAFIGGVEGYEHHSVFENAEAVAFLARYPLELGHTLVVPRDHREHVTADFTSEEYTDLQRVVHRVGEALRTVVPTERLYVLSLGSQIANRHVHWHVVPCPPGRPYEEQQMEALRTERGYLDVPAEAVTELAERIRGAIP